MVSEGYLSILNFWEENDIHKKSLKKRKDGKKFYLCDGPPYVTGGIHLGHVLNKSLKDAICRYKMMSGYDVYVRAGFDTHGLPIEIKVEKEIGIKNKKEIEKDVTNFIKKCKEYAENYINIQTKEFKNFGIWQDFEDPYITFKDEYIEKCWSTIKVANDKGLLTNDFYVVPYCPRCETPLANYELEYKDMSDPSIYIKFKVDRKENEYLIIWTTTPWTLVGNIAVMAHPMLKYVKAKVGEETWIVAKDTIDRVSKETDQSLTILEEFSGKELTELTYSHPLSDEIEKQKFPHKIVMAEEFVTTEEGTGLVHCAPGHGPEDYIIGKRYDLPIFSPIGSDAKYTTEAGKYEGVYVPEANELIIKELKKKGVLIKSSEIMHRYPQCWRCKTKLIHIASKQWFIKVNDIKSKMIEENEKVRWIPEFGGVWFSNFLENARDWCISRQRYWGIPLPIWKCEKCGAIKVIGSKEELEKESSGAKSKELHRPYVDEIKLKCKCGGEMIRVQDVLDVWFDSGNAIWAGLRKGEEKYYPADMILEGKDQIRGWFYSLLGSGVVLNNEVPYKSVIMHGYVVNEEGKEMSKSVGNYVPVEEILKKYEPDAVRLWCLGSVIWEDLRFHWKEIDVAKNDLNIITNIGTYIKRFYKKSKDKKAEEKEEIEDVWLSSRLNQLIKDCTNNMENGEIHRAVRNLKEFSVSELSRFYLKLIKKRENINKLYSTYFTLLKLLSPFIPFTSEKLYREIYADSEGKESIYLFDWPEPDESVIDEMLNSQLKMVDEICSELNGIRSEKDIKIRQPLEEAIIITDSIEVRDALDKFSNVVSKLINVKNIRTESEFKITKEYTEKKTRFGTLALKTELNQEMMDKGVMNEIRRRIQIMRKEVGLIEEDKINVYLNCEKEKYAKEIKKIVTERMDEIKKEVNAENIKFESGGRNKKSWKINDKKIEFGITKI